MTELTPIEAINEFYRLKDKYESSYYEKYVKPIVYSKKSKREKRVAFSKLPKHECINCKRNVGTVFVTKMVENVRQFKAKCGDVQEPCPLDIDITYGKREQINQMIKEGMGLIDGIKLNIIKEKNNALFFNKDVLKIFNDLTEELKLETENTGFIVETNILRNDNPEKAQVLREAIDEFGKGFIIPFKQMVKEYDETNNELIMNQAVTFYVNEMIPKLKEIFELKYDVSMVEYNEEKNIYNLVQILNSLEKNEFYYPGDDKVVKFVKGVKKVKKQTVRSKEAKPRKTRKIKPMNEIVLEVEDFLDDDDVGNGVDLGNGIDLELDNKYSDVSNEEPIFDDAGNVSWNNKEYDNLWKMMPQTLRGMLLEDHKWLEDYMNACVKARRARQPCTLILPRQTKLPPTKDEKGTYDFGTEIVNKLFNGLSKSHQDTLLSVYTTKEDGTKDYSELKNSLASLLAKQVNFDNPYF